MNKIKRTKFNVSLLGETQVGKTSLFNVKSGFHFNPNQLATVGIDNFLDKQIFNGIEYKFKIFDTAGQERYNKVVASTIKVADGYVLVFSVDQKSSLDRISTWLKYLEDNVDLKEKGLILIGNKIDLIGVDGREREVTVEEGQNTCKEKDLVWGGECSVKNIEYPELQNLFQDYVKLIYNKVGEKIVVKQSRKKLEKYKKKKCCS